ncbi:TonB-dependent receptor [Spirosoma telluris]|uniref:carboxypeptidase-like regulatory domain-containing protein n=1 Tax=Spirosoma telluris TaxID=2183553 RepID=UPI002FC3454B
MVEPLALAKDREEKLMRTYWKVYLLISVLIRTISLGWAQSAACNKVVQGRIVGLDTREPLIGATVYIRELQTGTVADSTGAFRIDHLCIGKYMIDYQFVGYKTKTVSITVGTDSSRMIATVQLVPDNQLLKEVVVTEHRSEAQQLLQTQVSLSGAALDQTRGQSLGESLKSLAGLYSIQTGPSISKPVIHGLYSNRIIILNNGIRQEDQQWGTEHAPQVDQFLASRLTVIKGAASIRYGSDAIGVSF